VSVTEVSSAFSHGGTSDGSASSLARAFLERMGAHDVEGALQLVEPQATVDLVPLKLQGPAAEVGRCYLEELVRAFPDLQVHVKRLFVGSDGTAVAEVVVEGVQAADFFGVVNQEKHMDLDQVWLLHVEAGRIDRVRAYWCQNRLYRRLGVKRLDRVSIIA